VPRYKFPNAPVIELATIIRSSLPPANGAAVNPDDSLDIPEFLRRTSLNAPLRLGGLLETSAGQEKHRQHELAAVMQARHFLPLLPFQASDCVKEKIVLDGKKSQTGRRRRDRIRASRKSLQQNRI
jgi:hypothetical protein